MAKTKLSDTLVLTFDNIKYAAINNLKYLETEKINLMISIEIETIANSNFYYELKQKSNSLSA